jgi:hypothetical protein
VTNCEHKQLSGNRGQLIQSATILCFMAILKINSTNSSQNQIEELCNTTNLHLLSFLLVGNPMHSCHPICQDNYVYLKLEEHNETDDDAYTLHI